MKWRNLVKHTAADGRGLQGAPFRNEVGQMLGIAKKKAAARRCPMDEVRFASDSGAITDSLEFRVGPILLKNTGSNSM